MYNFSPLAIQKDAILVGIVAFQLLMGAPNNEKKYDRNSFPFQFGTSISKHQIHLRVISY